ncbi:unnamed protein product, partial [Polarella glacialis]
VAQPLRRKLAAQPPGRKAGASRAAEVPSLVAKGVLIRAKSAREAATGAAIATVANPAPWDLASRTTEEEATVAEIAVATAIVTETVAAIVIAIGAVTAIETAAAALTASGPEGAATVVATATVATVTEE